MLLRDFLFEYEELELKMNIISATFSFCYMDLSEQTSEQAEMVIDGLLNQIHTLSEQMHELMQRGWDEVQRSVV